MGQREMGGRIMTTGTRHPNQPANSAQGETTMEQDTAEIPGATWV